MFDLDQFIADLRAALGEQSRQALKEVVARAVADPASLLRQIERPVASTENLKPVGICGEQGGDTEAGGEPNLLAEMVDGKVREAVAERLGDLGSAGVRSAGQDCDKLLSTEAGDVVDLA